MKIRCILQLPVSLWTKILGSSLDNLEPAWKPLGAMQEFRNGLISLKLRLRISESWADVHRLLLSASPHSYVASWPSSSSITGGNMAVPAGREGTLLCSGR